ncbi:MAG: hypothetical protein HYZ28_10765 [Myxococcales bacterium]|nr:hypothetical protein [Myxococcales bacterium]
MASFKHLLLVAGALAFSACVRHAAKIPGKASADLSCPASQITVMELGGGDTGQHLVSGCGKKAIYEVNPLGDWVLNAPPTVDPSYVTPERAQN